MPAVCHACGTRECGGFDERTELRTGGRPTASAGTVAGGGRGVWGGGLVANNDPTIRFAP